ncbi:MAG: DmsC/YnfH family molybdoenzyme membrane anchor subunit [Verrucomicrobiota bacterium]
MGSVLEIGSVARKATVSPVSLNGHSADNVETLVDQLLREQNELTAVDRFSQRHESATEPVFSRHYRDLIPIRKPQTGEQYAFEVDLDACSGCKACVAACHSLNGLDEGESWRQVGSLATVSGDVPRHETVTSACHHCLDPGCLEGCPVMAYEKEEDTGIVRHLDDQCIGCKYCELKCPYDVPKYNKSLGIVRKCDMCHDRLAEGEAPACVQSCPNEAIKIRLVNVDETRKTNEEKTEMLPGVFDSRYTQPTTTYTGSLMGGDAAEAADERKLKTSHPHWPLIVMLVLTQAGLGLSIPAVVLGDFWTSIAAFAFAQAGLIAAAFHLGRPLQAWRVFLGLKTSWLSREVIAFSMWMPFVAGHPFFLWLGMPTLALLTGMAGIAMGVISVACSAMVYVDTRRPFWSYSRSFTKFGGTVAVMAAGGFGGVGVFLIALLAKLAVEIRDYLPLRDERWGPLKKSALILKARLREVTWLRLGVLATAILLAFAGHFVPALLLVVSGEILERFQFFTAVTQPKMPGEL